MSVYTLTAHVRSTPSGSSTCTATAIRRSSSRSVLRPRPTLVTLRVVFVALALLSCGLLAWAAMLRLAIVTRKQRDWWLLGLVLALNAGLIAYLGSLPPEDEVMTDGQAIITLSWMLVVFVGTVTYYLYTDIRHFGPYGGPPAGRARLPTPVRTPLRTAPRTRGRPRLPARRSAAAGPALPCPRLPARRRGRAPHRRHPPHRPTLRGPPPPSASTRCAPSSTS